jgi:predicted double-glycine peptidase
MDYRVFTLLPCVMLLVSWGAECATGQATKRNRFPGPDRQFNAEIQPWTATKSKNVVKQQREYTCGAASVATILRYYYKDPISEEQILLASLGDLSAEEITDREKNGLSMGDLVRGVGKLEYVAAVLKLEYDKLATLPAPVVIRLIKDDFKHFVVFRGELDGWVFVADPLRGNVRIPQPEFRKQWDGNVLAIVRRGMQPLREHPLQISPNTPAVPQIQAARRGVVEAPAFPRPVR